MIRNHTILTLLAGAVLGAVPGVTAQQNPPAAEAKPQERAKADEATIRKWIEALGADEHDARREAERALAEVGDAARPLLQKAVEEHDDPEVRWRARRVLRGLDGEAPRLQRRDADQGAPDRAAPPAAKDPAEIHDELRDMIEQLQRGFGEDLGRLRDLGEIQRQMAEIQRRFDAFDRGFGSPGPMPGMGGPDRAMAQGMQVQIGPDGVRVQVQEKGEDGKTETKTYEAESLDAFREQYPEIAKRFLGGGGFGFQGFGLREFRDTDGDGLPDVRVLTPRPPGGAVRIEPAPFEVVPAPDVAPPAEGERLGVYVGELAPAVRAFLEIPDGQGLLVERVEEGSLAADLGVRAKDVVLRVGDRDVADPADIRAALRGIAKGEKVAVTVNRRGETVELSATKQHDAPAESGKLRRATPDGDAPQQKR